MGITGTWVNSYGSSMILAQDATTGAISGTYQSSTGSTGVYNVLGYALPGFATPALGEAFALSIFWLSTAGGPSDPSWHWVSGLGGQAVSAGTSSQTLNLIHCLVATDAFPDLAQPGSYVDKLVYESTPIASSTGIAASLARPALRKAMSVMPNPINGSWVCGAAPGIVLVLSLVDQDTGQVAGSLTYGGSTYTLNGFTDCNAVSDKIPLQGLAVTAALADQNMVISLSGSLEFSSGQLTLTQLLNQGTANTATYVQTTVDQLVFTLASAD